MSIKVYFNTKQDNITINIISVQILILIKSASLKAVGSL